MSPTMGEALLRVDAAGALRVRAICRAGGDGFAFLKQLDAAVGVLEDVGDVQGLLWLAAELEREASDDASTTAPSDVRPRGLDDGQEYSGDGAIPGTTRFDPTSSGSGEILEGNTKVRGEDFDDGKGPHIVNTPRRPFDDGQSGCPAMVG